MLVQVLLQKQKHHDAVRKPAGSLTMGGKHIPCCVITIKDFQID